MQQSYHMVEASPSLWYMQFVSLDCLLQYHQSQLPLAVSRVLVQIFLPFAILAFFCFVWLLVYLFLQQQQPDGNRNLGWLTKKCQISAYSVLGFFYPSITQAALSIFSCYPIDAPVPANTPYKAFVMVSGL